MPINWIRILANSGKAFFTTLLGVLGVDAMVGLPVTDILTLALPAVIAGAIQAGFTFFSEVAQSQENSTRGSSRNKKGSSSIFNIIALS